MFRLRHFLFIVLFPLATSLSYAEDNDDISMKYLVFLALKYQFQFYKDHCGTKFSSKISLAEEDFISKNSLLTEIKNNPPSNASTLLKEAEEELPIFDGVMKDLFDKFPDQHDYFCDFFIQRLQTTSFEELLTVANNFKIKAKPKVDKEK